MAVNFFTKARDIALAHKGSKMTSLRPAARNVNLARSCLAHVLGRKLKLERRKNARANKTILEQGSKDLDQVLEKWFEDSRAKGIRQKILDLARQHRTDAAWAPKALEKVATSSTSVASWAQSNASPVPEPVDEALEDASSVSVEEEVYASEDELESHEEYEVNTELDSSSTAASWSWWTTDTSMFE
jgi:hypothetical protein